MKKFIIITLTIIVIDQIIKIYVKTHFNLGSTFLILPYLEFCFVENPGMACGLYLINGYKGKIILSFIRICIIIYIIKFIYKKYKYNIKNNFLIPISLILAGSFSNILDNLFYGLIFDSGMIFSSYFNKWIPYYGISHFNIYKGYSFFMGGAVVDMIALSIKHLYIPEYIPFIGGYNIYNFKSIFNIADISIFVGSILIIFFHKKYNKFI